MEEEDRMNSEEEKISELISQLIELKRRKQSDIIQREHELMTEMIAAAKEENDNILKITFRGKLLAIVTFQVVNNTCVLKKHYISSIFGNADFTPIFKHMFYLGLDGYSRYRVDQNFEGPLPDQVKKGSTIELSSMFRQKPKFLKTGINKYRISEEPLPEDVLDDRGKFFLTVEGDDVYHQFIDFNLGNRKYMEMVERANILFDRHTPKNELVFRWVRPEDVYEIWGLHRWGMNQYRVGIPESQRLRFYSDLLDPERYLRENGVFIVAEYRGEIIGMGACKRIDSGEAELTRFSVAKPYQRLGIGSVILSLVLHLAAERGYTRFFLRTSERQKAFDFYKSKEQFSEAEPEKGQGVKRIQSGELNRLFRICGEVLLNKELVKELRGEKEKPGVDLISMEKFLGEEDFVRYQVNHDKLAEHENISSFKFNINALPWAKLKKSGMQRPTKRDVELQKSRDTKTDMLLENLMGDGERSLARAYEEDEGMTRRYEIEPSRISPYWTGPRNLKPRSLEQIRRLLIYTIYYADHPVKAAEYQRIIFGTEQPRLRFWSKSRLSGKLKKNKRPPKANYRRDVIFRRRGRGRVASR